MNGKDSQTSSNNDLAAALAQFNSGVTASRQLDKEAKAIAKAEKRRDAAAQKLKELMEKETSPEDKAAAEEEYRTAADEWTRLTNPDATTAELSEEPAVEGSTSEISAPEEPTEIASLAADTEDQEPT
ncbi:MAG: hypothetical protein QGF99_07440 [Acidimicrobiales bacterium]|jgi:isopropylmalate/homocitrate/citramalate synthase|nr:hypothetical protein [Acidimicrobiales bacterium]MDP6901808.1 hypothetical protein [Acidimicrobiales bacterium]HJL99170.1 hypothetical protein [Acidimicrobiales bacterium]